MTAHLIINADDFGLTRGINRAIGELHSASVVSSTTLMACGAAFDDAVEVARAQPTLGVGCHVVLVDGVPISPPESIRSLIGADGRSFRPTLGSFVRAIFLGRIDEADVAREALAQVERLQRAGLTVSHLDTHKHVHLFPSIARPILQVADRCGIRAVRNPFEPRWSLALGLGSLTRRLEIRLLGALRSRFVSLPQIRDGRVRTTDGTAAISATGQLNSASLAEILRTLPADGTYEICCHPGYNDSDLDRVTTRLRETRNVEREALLHEVPQSLSRVNAPTLVSYASLAAETVSADTAASVRF
jgi:predicted glycoside hydrolase/deacetylase ChbG (UPF0249 family)